jgi:hypothetical protein
MDKDGANDKGAEDDDDAEEGDSCSVDESDTNSETAEMVPGGVTTAEVRRLSRKNWPDPIAHACTLGEHFLGRRSQFVDSTGHIFAFDFLGAAKKQCPFLSRVDLRDVSLPLYPSLALEAVKEAPRLPDDWDDALVAVAFFGESSSCLVATRVGEGGGGVVHNTL